MSENNPAETNEEPAANNAAADAEQPEAAEPKRRPSEWRLRFPYAPANIMGPLSSPALTIEFLAEENFDRQWAVNQGCQLPPAVADRLTADAADLAEVARLAELAAQIKAAEVQAARAAARIDHARAGRRVLELDPVPAMADRLRELDVELAEAAAAGRQAEEDLRLLRPLVGQLQAAARAKVLGSAGREVRVFASAAQGRAADARRRLIEAIVEADVLDEYVVSSAIAITLGPGSPAFLSQLAEGLAAVVVGRVLDSVKVPTGGAAAGAAPQSVPAAEAPPSSPAVPPVAPPPAPEKPRGPVPLPRIVDGGW